MRKDDAMEGGYAFPGGPGFHHESKVNEDRIGNDGRRMPCPFEIYKPTGQRCRVKSYNHPCGVLTSFKIHLRHERHAVLLMRRRRLEDLETWLTVFFLEEKGDASPVFVGSCADVGGGEGGETGWGEGVVYKGEAGCARVCVAETEEV